MGNSVRGGTGRWCPGGRATATQRAAGRGLHPSAVTAVRPCGEAAGARARSLLDLGPVAPGALRADWPTGPEEVGRFRRADAAAGFGGRLRRLGQFQFLITPAGLAGPCGSSPLAGLLSLLEDATKWRRRGAELWREFVGRGVFGREPRWNRCLFPGRRACPGTCGAWLGSPRGTRDLGRRSRKPYGRRRFGPRQARGAEQRGLVRPLQWLASLGAYRGPSSCRSGTTHL